MAATTSEIRTGYLERRQAGGLRWKKVLCTLTDTEFRHNSKGFFLLFFSHVVNLYASVLALNEIFQVKQISKEMSVTLKAKKSPVILRAADENLIAGFLDQFSSFLEYVYIGGSRISTRSFLPALKTQNTFYLSLLKKSRFPFQVYFYMSFSSHS